MQDSCSASQLSFLLYCFLLYCFLLYCFLLYCMED
jgi:hypothetical protein